MEDLATPKPLFDYRKIDDDAAKLAERSRMSRIIARSNRRNEADPGRIRIKKRALKAATLIE